MNTFTSEQAAESEQNSTCKDICLVLPYSLKEMPALDQVIRLTCGLRGFTPASLSHCSVS